MKTLLIILLLMLSLNIAAQERKPILLGLQPAVTKEQFYKDNEFDVNIFPVFIQIPVHPRVDIRSTVVVNYHFGPENGLSDLGEELVTPIFIKKKSSTNSKSSCLYIGPQFGFGRNVLNDHYTYTLSAEPGYLFPIKNKFTPALGMQIGSSYFDYDNQADLWRQHFAMKINLGFWL